MVLLGILYVVVLWWFATGAILFLDGLPRRTFRFTIAGGAVLGALGLVMAHGAAGLPGALPVIAGFTGALLLWAFNEVLFLTGAVTGPLRGPGPAGARGVARFRAAAATVLWHEAALVGTAAVLWLVTADDPLRIAFWTFMALWIMRLSTKLNIFAGVPNPAEEFLPPHLAYLKDHFRIAPMTMLFPLTVTAITLVWAAVVMAAWAAPGPEAMLALALLATLLALGVLEHWFLVVPWPAAALWRWGLASRGMSSHNMPVETTHDATVGGAPPALRRQENVRPSTSVAERLKPEHDRHGAGRQHQDAGVEPAAADTPARLRLVATPAARLLGREAHGL